jgi:uncharacterized membrane protein
MLWSFYFACYNFVNERNFGGEAMAKVDKQREQQKQLEEMRQHAQEKYISEHPELAGLDGEELKGAMIEIAEQKETTRKIRLREHLEMFSDAVIAIIITIMVLEIPLPLKEDGASYLEFLQAIGMFLVSFFLVASFWLDHHRSFDDVEHISDKVLIADFVFMASLSVMPIMTKWIMLDIHTFAVINFGVVYLVVNLLEGLLLIFIAREKYQSDPDILKIYSRYIGIRQIMTIVISTALIGLAFVQPMLAMIWFLAIPIVSFILSGRDSRKRADTINQRVRGRNSPKGDMHVGGEDIIREIENL